MSPNGRWWWNGSQWRPAPIARRLRWWLLVACVAVMTLVAASCTAIIVASAYCGSRGDCSSPTDPADFNQLRLIDDTAAPIRAVVCDDQTCKYGIDQGVVKAHGSLGTDVSWAEGDAHLKLVQIDGLTRCISFNNAKKVDREIDMSASAATAC